MICGRCKTGFGDWQEACPACGTRVRPPRVIARVVAAFRRGAALIGLAAGVLVFLAAGYLLASRHLPLSFWTVPLVLEVLDRAADHAGVVSQLGEPVRLRGPVRGTVGADETGWREFVLSVPLRGPKGSAELRVRAGRGRQGPWTFTTLALETGTGVDIDVMDPPRGRFPMPPGGRRLYLAPLGEVKRVSLEELARYYRSWLGHAVHLLPPVTPTGSLVDHARQQVIAEAAVEAVRWRVGDLGVDPSAIVIAITDEDMYIRHSSRRSAFSYRGDERFAVVSAARMAPVAYEYRGKEYLFHSRLRKIVGNNIGLLLYRFPTSLDPTSLLYEKILSVADLDTMRNDFQELGVRAAAVDFPVSHRQPPIEAEITHDRLAGLDLTPGNIERTRRLLQDWWGVADRHSLLASLKWIEESGHRARFALWGAWLAVLAPDERKALASRRQKDFELHQTLGVVETHHQRLGSKSLVGWDFSRHINVCRWGYAAGYLSEAEAWAKIAPAARTLRHTFTSWRELGENYLIGRQFWSPEEHFRSGNLFRMAFDRLLADPNSPWNQVPWDLDLGPPPLGP